MSDRKILKFSHCVSPRTDRYLWTQNTFKLAFSSKNLWKNLGNSTLNPTLVSKSFWNITSTFNTICFKSKNDLRKKLVRKKKRDPNKYYYRTQIHFLLQLTCMYLTFMDDWVTMYLYCTKTVLIVKVLESYSAS